MEWRDLIHNLVADAVRALLADLLTFGVVPLKLCALLGTGAGARGGKLDVAFSADPACNSRARSISASSSAPIRSAALDTQSQTKKTMTPARDP